MLGRSGPDPPLGSPSAHLDLGGDPTHDLSWPSGRSRGVPRSPARVPGAYLEPDSWTRLQFSIATTQAGAAPGSYAPAGTPRRTGSRSTTSPTPSGPSRGPAPRSSTASAGSSGTAPR